MHVHGSAPLALLLALACTEPSEVQTQALVPAVPVSPAAPVPPPAPVPLAPGPPPAGPPLVPARDPVDVLREQILAHARLEPGMVVAEIGASHGWFVDRGSIAIGPQGRLYATDVDPTAIAALHEQQQHENPARAPVEVRLCRHPRDTGLDDLQDGVVDVILMIDSLCFDQPGQRSGDLTYLREFLRVLAPGGRMIHHMDCRCSVSPQQVLELFEAAGFVRLDDPVLITDIPEYCVGAEQRGLYAFVATLGKPG